MIVTTCGAVCFLSTGRTFTRDGGAAFLGGCAGACAIVATQHNNTLVNVATRLAMVTDIFLKLYSVYQTPFGANWFPVATARCEPKLIVGTEIVRALPWPSSIETLNDCNEASTGKIAACRCESENSVAPSLARSRTAIGRFGCTGLSFLILRGASFEATAGRCTNGCSLTSTGLGAGPVGCSSRTATCGSDVPAGGGVTMLRRTRTTPVTNNSNIAATATPFVANGHCSTLK